MNQSIASLIAGLPLLQAAASGAVLFADTFDRADSRNIQASLGGITNNTGTAFEAGGNPGGTPVYLHGHLDPANRFSGGFSAPDGNAANGGGARIISNTLQLAAEAGGTSNALINHNFVNASILAAGGFSVSVDLIGLTHTGATDNGFGAGFAVGLPLAAGNPGGTGDAFNGDSRITGGFGTNLNAAVPSQSLSDFWVVLRANGSLAWGGNDGSPATVTGITGLGSNPTGNVTVNFLLDSFAAGSTVNYEVLLDSIPQGTGTFTWSGDNENYIGLDGRASLGAALDNLLIRTIPEPSAVLLGFVGWVFLLRRKR